MAQGQRGGDRPTTAAGGADGPGLAAGSGSRRPRRSRAQARAEMTGAILNAGRRQLAEHGAPGLSLRAVARELGVVSSAVYRYVSTRDDLLTLLIAAAYNDLGDAVEASQETVGEVPPADRFAAACRAIRTWALTHPHEYALIFGSPVPGYHAPEVTTAAAARIPAVFAALLRAGCSTGTGRREADSPDPGQDGTPAAGRPGARPDGPGVPDVGGAVGPDAATAIAPAMAFMGAGLGPEQVLNAVLVWAAVFGTVSFEVFGRFDDSIAGDPEMRATFFDAGIRRWADDLGLTVSPPEPTLPS